ncbi:hypothetical protein KUTeg_007292 [Tegillarca granosa]|uniref:Uncharacterized protein n=1 Tax=Tegillarca granosa TaxID=220873 RepID=A0ABQ9FCT9_TEGGR|nr:hypothetical protein KUTeg_007292 [Tegillarca granosa]
MTPDELYVNITWAINFLVSLLKKNWQNVRALYIKSTMTSAQLSLWLFICLMLFKWMDGILVGINWDVYFEMSYLQATAETRGKRWKYYNISTLIGEFSPDIGTVAVGAGVPGNIPFTLGTDEFVVVLAYESINPFWRFIGGVAVDITGLLDFGAPGDLLLSPDLTLDPDDTGTNTRDSGFSAGFSFSGVLGFSGVFGLSGVGALAGSSGMNNQIIGILALNYMY